MGERITIDGKEYTGYGNKWYDLERYVPAPPDVLEKIHGLLEKQERKREEARRPFEQLREQYQDDKLWNRLASPDPASGEVWLNPQILADIEQTLAKQKCTSNLEDAESFCRHCWNEIKSAQRRYQVSSQGRVVILATEELSKLIGLKSVRFIQERARAPEVFVRFEFRDPSAIGVIRVKANGSTVGFHEASASDLFQAIIETTALAYYRDLVIPRVHYYPYSGKRRTSRKPTTSRRARPLPRVQSISISLPRPYRFDEWHQAQARARHYVVGHLRWVGEGFKADWEKQAQARRAGVNLPLCYTWVIEHERSGGEPSGPTFNGTDLVERTRFLPPERASHELDKLFPTPGIY